ncbi:flavin reductase family protein [Streptomyces sp. NPDC002773]|uniref:flavin reductase family protein n=1 Tax=Streptomyces sp. NPDC002773 TaxID=3154430 RepID=UPI0033311350
MSAGPAAALGLPPPGGELAEPDPEVFWDSARQFPTGVAVLTADHPLGPHGTTVSSFAFVSRRPPLISVCLKRPSSFLSLVRSGGEFGVNVLVHEQAVLARRFATPGRAPGATQFEGVPYAAGDASGAPLLDGSAAWLECRVDRVLAAGDHDLVLARVLFARRAAASTQCSPLVYHAGRFATTQTQE